MNKKINYIVFSFVFMFLFMISNVYAGELVVNKDEVIAAGLDINSFSASYETSGSNIYKYWDSSKETDVILHLKGYYDESIKPYASFIGVYIDGNMYSKEQAIATFPTFKVIKWEKNCIEYTIQIHIKANARTGKYGFVQGYNKLPDNIEAAYIYPRVDYELYNLDDLENPILSKYGEVLVSKIVDKKNVNVVSSIANIKNGVVGEYGKYASSVKQGDEVSVKVVLNRPYGVLNSGNLSLTGEIPEGFSYVSGSASYTNSAGYPDVLTIDESTGVPILKFSNMPVGENTVFTFKMKAEEDAKNVTDTVVLENIFQKSIKTLSIILNIQPDWYPNNAYSADEYIQKDYNYINTVFNVMYDSNGGEGQVIDGNSYSYDDDGTTAIILGNSSISKDGYEFKGWNTSSDGSGEFYHEGDNVSLTKDILLYAIWEPISGSDNPNTSDNIYNILVLLFSSLMLFIIVNKFLFKKVK